MERLQLKTFSGLSHTVFSHLLFRISSIDLRRNSRESPEPLTWTFSHTDRPENVRRLSGIQCTSESSFVVYKTLNGQGLKCISEMVASGVLELEGEMAFGHYAARCRNQLPMESTIT